MAFGESRDEVNWVSMSHSSHSVEAEKVEEGPS
jgi:hypothetical protein